MSHPNQFYVAANTLERITASAAGSFSRLLFCPEEYVDFTTNYPGYFSPNPATGKLDQELIEPFAGYSFLEAKVPNSKKGYLEVQKSSDAGSFLEITINALVPYGSADNHQRLDIIKYHRHIMLLQFPNGLVKVIGNKGNGARFTQSDDSGDRFREVPGTAIKFTVTQEDKPLLYTLALPA